MSYSVVWFKRDLRVADHAALHAAAQRGPVLCLHVIEPNVWAQPEVRAGKAAIVEKHASRAKNPASKSTSRGKATAKPENPQIALDF